MTQPEKEFELRPGSWVAENYHENGVDVRRKAWLFGFDSNEHDAVIRPANGVCPVYVNRKALTEWNPDPKPKSFEEEREEIINELYGFQRWSANEQFHSDLDKTIARIRALQPDAPAAATVSYESKYAGRVVTGSIETAAKWLTSYEKRLFDYEAKITELKDELTTLTSKPKSFNERAEVLADEIGSRLAAAVAGSAEPVGYFSSSRSAPFDFLSPFGWGELHDEARALYRPVYFAPPSPPRPNPVGPEMDTPKPIAAIETHGPGIYPLTTHYRNEAFSLSSGMYDVYLAPLIPPAAIAAFDEAAERKLFAMAFPEFRAGGYETELKVQGWLASAKVQRWAVPALVAESANEADDDPSLTRPYTTEELAQWLDAKHRRHHEEEDQLAAERLRALQLRLDAEGKEVSEVRKELEKLAPTTHLEPILRSLAAKLGAAE